MVGKFQSIHETAAFCSPLWINPGTPKLWDMYLSLTEPELMQVYSIQNLYHKESCSFFFFFTSFSILILPKKKTLSGVNVRLTPF